MSVTDTVPARNPVHPALWVMVAVMIGFELMFSAVDAGLLPAALGRGPVYERLAFFDVLFEHSRAGIHFYPEMLWTPLTHAFLHAGWLHLGFNAAAFLGLGHGLVQQIGIGRCLAVFALSAIAGALTFGLIADTPGPLVGASGAIFGMLAVFTAWQERALRWAGLSRAPIWRRIFGLVLLNVILTLGLRGALAWEAHLGGWIAGWLLAGVFRPHRSVLA